MKKLLYTLIALLALNGSALAQLDANRTTSTRIADLLAQMPANDAAELERNAKEIAAMGAEGIVQMAGMMGAPGKGDNSRLEYALGGFSLYITQQGKEEWRQLAEKAYCLSLEKAADKEVKAFLIRQLQAVGSDESVAALQTYLNDERLCDPAARALVQVGSPAAGQALLQALKDAQGACQLSLVEGLGDLRYAEAAETLSGYAESGDDDLRKVSLYALAAIADPASGKILSRAAAGSNYSYEVTDANASYLRYLQRLAEEGEERTAAKLARKLLKRTGGEGQVHTRTAALKLLAGMQGKESLPLLLKAMKSDDPQYRLAALEYARALGSPAATALWVKELGRS
ncbi:MAG TPA: HEAT repeat domain-containing protein, partial [Anseongella sp.]|nr:HEAT repeat domain-containing protein [Anseongella sp.]